MLMASTGAMIQIALFIVLLGVLIRELSFRRRSLAFSIRIASVSTDGSSSEW